MLQHQQRAEELLDARGKLDEPVENFVKLVTANAKSDVDTTASVKYQMQSPSSSLQALPPGARGTGPGYEGKFIPTAEEYAALIARSERWRLEKVLAREANEHRLQALSKEHNSADVVRACLATPGLYFKYDLIVAKYDLGQISWLRNPSKWASQARKVAKLESDVKRANETYKRQERLINRLKQKLS